MPFFFHYSLDPFLDHDEKELLNVLLERGFSNMEPKLNDDRTKLIVKSNVNLNDEMLEILNWSICVYEERL